MPANHSKYTLIKHGDMKYIVVADQTVVLELDVYREHKGLMDCRIDQRPVQAIVHTDTLISEPPEVLVYVEAGRKSYFQGPHAVHHISVGGQGKGAIIGDVVLLEDQEIEVTTSDGALTVLVSIPLKEAYDKFKGNKVTETGTMSALTIKIGDLELASNGLQTFDGLYEYGTRKCMYRHAHVITTGGTMTTIDKYAYTVNLWIVSKV